MEKPLQEILDSVEADEPRSRLEPYRELILRLRRDGRTYRRIVKVLDEKCGIRVTVSNLHEFVQRRARPKKENVAKMTSTNTVIETQTLAAAAPVPAPQQETYPGPKRMTPEERAAALERMRMLRETPVVVPEKKKRYVYNPDEPLILEKPIKEKK